MISKEDSASIMMKCGHAANGVRHTEGGEWVPCCVICAGIDGSGDVPDDAPPDLTDRTSRCDYYGSTPRLRRSSREGPCGRGACLCEKPSSPSLPFFESRPDQASDRHYCGCRGWD